MANVAPTFPIKPFGGRGGTWGADLMTLPVEPTNGGDTIFGDGDIVVIDATTRDATSSNAAATGVFGVAATTGFTAPTTIDRDGDINTDLVQVYPAWPSRRFAGTVIETVPNDHTGVYVDDIRDTDLMGLLESSDGFACLNELNTTDRMAYVLEYVTPQTQQRATDNVVVTQFGREAGVGLLNPRVVFIFNQLNTLFGNTA